MRSAHMLIHWMPRLLALLAIFFISLFAFDSFNPDHTVLRQIGDTLLQLVPSAVLLIVLWVAWRREKIGGIIFMALALALCPPVFLLNYQRNHSIWQSTQVLLFINAPFVIAGLLFVISGVIKNRTAH